MLRWGMMIACVALGATRARAAAPPWDPPLAGDPVAIAREAAKVATGPRDDAQLLLEDTRIELAADGRATFTRRSTARVVTQAGVARFSDVTLDWAEWFEERPAIRARVIAPDGSVRTLDPATIEVRASNDDTPGVYTDEKLVRAPLPGVVAGAVIELEVVSREHRPFFAAGRLLRQALRYSTPTLRSRLVVDAPASLPLSWKVFHARGVEPRRSAARGRVILTLDRSAVPGDDELEPGRPDDWPFIALATGRSWSDVATGYAQLVDDAIAAGDVAELALAARGDAAGRDAIAARLLERVHRDVRYVSISFGDASIVPRSPKETLARGFGDCKDQATLLVAMLRGAGIPAHVALLRPGTRTDVDASLPALSFTHAIVYVPGTPALWIDPTDRFARAGELPVGDRGRRALVAARDTRGLTDTPPPRAADDTIVEERTLLLGEDGPARVIEVTRRTGELERAYRAYRDQADADEDRRHLAEYLDSTYLDAKLETLSATDPRDLRAPAELRLEGSGSRRGATDGQRAVGYVFPSSPVQFLPDPLGEKPAPGEKRRHPLLVEYPFTVEVRTRLVPPPGDASRVLPEAQRHDIGPWQLTFDVTREADGLVLTRARLAVERTVLAPADVDQVRERASALREEDGVEVSFVSLVEEHLAAGRVKEAIVEERRLEALHPREALHAVRAADTLARAGLGAAARDEARRATQLDPGSAMAWYQLGLALAHDELGRNLEPGFDPRGAEAAYRKALALDAEHDDARLSLAILLEHDAAAQRYSKGARLDEAVKEYRTLWRERKVAAAAENLLYLLMYLGRTAEVRALAGELDRTPDRDAVLVAAIADKEGIDAAMREVNARARDGATRTTLLSNVYQQLLWLRSYDAARAVIAKQPSLITGPGIDRLRRAEEIAAPPGDPVALVRRMMATFCAPDPAPLGTLVVPRADPELDDLYAAWFLSRRLLESRGVPLPAAADIAATMARYDARGDARGGGWRVSVALAGTRPESAFFVVPWGRELRVAGEASELAAPALAALERRQVDVARRLVGWMSLYGTGLGQLAREELGEVRADSDAQALEAAAALTATGAIADEDRRVIPALERCAASAVAEPRRSRCAFALAWRLAERDRGAEAAAPLAVALAGRPDDAQLHGLGAALLWHAGRGADAERELAAATARLGDGVAAGAVAALQRMGRCEDAERAFARLGAAPPSREIAMGRVRCAARSGKLDDAMLAAATRGVELSQRRDPRWLGLLAYVHADRGELADARVVLEELAPTGSALRPAHWLALGRMAEQVGLTGEARRSYGKIARPAHPQPIGDWAIAQARLAALKK